MVSIIIPIFNAEKFLSVCLQSVLEQTYKNLEIILINDGSTDNSLNICNQFRDRDNRIIIKTIKNSGSSVARNIGISIARGEYIMFVDSDDIIDETLVEELLKTLKEKQVNIAVALGRKVTTNNLKVQTADIIDNKVNVINGKEKINFIFDHVSPWAKLYKHELFNKFKFKKGIVHQDFDLIPKIVYEQKEIAVINKQLYTYIIREDSISGNNYKKRSTDLYKIIDNSIRYYENIDKEDALMMISEYVIHGFKRFKRILAIGQKNKQKEFIRAYKRCYSKWIYVILRNKYISLEARIEILISIISVNLFYIILLFHLRRKIK